MCRQSGKPCHPPQMHVHAIKPMGSMLSDMQLGVTRALVPFVGSPPPPSPPCFSFFWSTAPRVRNYLVCDCVSRTRQCRAQARTKARPAPERSRGAATAFSRRAAFTQLSPRTRSQKHDAPAPPPHHPPRGPPHTHTHDTVSISRYAHGASPCSEAFMTNHSNTRGKGKGPMGGGFCLFFFFFSNFLQSAHGVRGAAVETSPLCLCSLTDRALPGAERRQSGTGDKTPSRGLTRRTDQHSDPITTRTRRFSSTLTLHRVNDLQRREE